MRRRRERPSIQEEALRIYLRGVLPPRESVEAERMLDALLEKASSSPSRRIRRKDLEAL